MLSSIIPLKVCCTLIPAISTHFSMSIMLFLFLPPVVCQFLVPIREIMQPRSNINNNNKKVALHRHWTATSAAVKATVSTDSIDTSVYELSNISPKRMRFRIPNARACVTSSYESRAWLETVSVYSLYCQLL